MKTLLSASPGSTRVSRVPLGVSPNGSEFHPPIPTHPSSSAPGNFKDSTPGFQPTFTAPMQHHRPANLRQVFTMPFTICSRSVHDPFTIVHAKFFPPSICAFVPAQAASSCSSEPSRLVSTCERSQSVRNCSRLFAPKIKKFQAHPNRTLGLPTSFDAAPFLRYLPRPSSCRAFT